MRKFGSFLLVAGIFSIIMTGLRLYRDGFARLEGTEGATWSGVLRILAPYIIVGLISLGVMALGGWLTGRPPSKAELMEKDERVVSFYQATLDAWKAGKLDHLHETFKTGGAVKKVGDLVTSYHPYNEPVMRTLFEKYPPAPGEFLVGVGYRWFVLTNKRLIHKDGKTGEFREIPLADIAAYDVLLDTQNTVICKLKSGEEIRFEDAKGYARADFMKKMLEAPLPV
jgi:hypothetical protein